MASLSEILKKSSDAVQLFERIDDLFKRVEQQSIQIVELQAEVVSLRTLLEERTRSLEKILDERGNTIKAEVARETVNTLADKLYDINDRFNEKLSSIETRMVRAIEDHRK